MVAERRIQVDANCISMVGTGLCTRIKQTPPATSEADEQSYRIDETHIRVKGRINICIESSIRPGKRSISC
jgi:transposase-like protein